MNEITPKQEKFANLYVELGNASEAYRQSHDVGTATKESVWVLASRVLNHVNVRLRVVELQNELGERFKISQGYVITNYLNIINDVNYTVDLAKLQSGEKEEVKKFYMMKEVNTVTDKIRAMENLSKMLGLNAPEKIDQEIKIEIVEKKRD